MRALLLAFLFATAVFSGCLEDDEPSDDPSTPVTDEPAPILPEIAPATVTALATYLESRVTVAASVANDLYEPTIEVCDDGSIYITGHTILVDTTGAPVYGSHDDGASWENLPFAGPAGLPGPQGSTPPPSDEIFLSCGEDGWLYGVDITLATYPVNAWSGYGTQLSYHNPNAYDEAKVVGSTERCTPVPAKDRPWGAYAAGTLLMVSNPAGGPAQVGVMDVPPALPAEVGGQVSTTWNLCAGPGGSIPGIPDIRADGLFAVPQRSSGGLYLTLGNKEDMAGVGWQEIFKHTSGGEITSVYGIAAFDLDGTLFVGISNNTAPDDNGDRVGQMLFASSTDGGQTFVNRTFVTGDRHLVHFYMDPNDFGSGALVVWATDGDTDGRYDWYTGHLFVDAIGAPVLENVVLAIDEGVQPSAHVTGAAVGPDGRAYIAMYDGSAIPLSVFVQQTGPTLPVEVAAVAAVGA